MELEIVGIYIHLKWLHPMFNGFLTMYPQMNMNLEIKIGKQGLQALMISCQCLLHGKEVHILARHQEPVFIESIL